MKKLPLYSSTQGDFSGSSGSVGAASPGRRARSVKTLLIYPPFSRLHGMKDRFFPIGLGYLAAALRRRDKQVAIYNAENYPDGEDLLNSHSALQTYRQFATYQKALDTSSHHVWREAREVIERYRPDLVGITVKSCMSPSSAILSRIVKQIDPEILVVWGGPHPSVAPSDALTCEAADMVVRHEGEETIVEIVEMLESGRKEWAAIDGLVWRDPERGLVHNRPRAYSMSLDDIAAPDKSADLMPERYAPDHYGVMFTSRGCPWPCTFCDSSGVWTRKLRIRSPEAILAEMEDLYSRFGVREFYFWDDTFTPNRKHSMRLFDLMIEHFHRRGRPITWRATTRCDCVDEELAEKMRASGCRLLVFGIESGSPRIMKILKKGITQQDVLRCQSVMRGANIPYETFFMIGFPDDTRESIEETMALIRQLDVPAMISIFTPYPNTHLYERARSYGLFEEPIEWRYHSHQSPGNNFVKNMSRDEFRRVAERCLAEVDRRNVRRYLVGRARHYLKNPREILPRLRSWLLGASRSHGPRVAHP